jgi:hypothetical protein
MAAAPMSLAAKDLFRLSWHFAPSVHHRGRARFNRTSSGAKIQSEEYDSGGNNVENFPAPTDQATQVLRKNHQHQY